MMITSLGEDEKMMVENNLAAAAEEAVARWS
jgi:hypothetical protein